MLDDSVKTPNIATLDLGIGAIKSPGFIGLDCLALPGVNIIADLNAPLPFSDNSFDLIFSSHGLEHVNDLIATMTEVYRVSQHGAQVCIVAPYSAQAINAANPYHKQMFNEHTPRFWTSSPHTSIDRAEYDHPHAAMWGLSQSDNSDTGIDFRCLRMEFFYFPEYRYLPLDQQRAARKKYIDVCDVIVYHLLVVKKTMSEDDMQELAKRVEYYDPPYVAIRRLQEELEKTKSQLNESHAKHNADLATYNTALEQLRSELTPHETALARTRSALATRESELAEERRLAQTREAMLEQNGLKGKAAARELGAFRDRRIVCILERFTNHSTMWDVAGEPFQQLKDDTLSFGPDLRGYLLQPSENLQHVPFLYYPLELGRANLAGILLAPILDFPSANGTLGVEIVSPENTIVAQAAIPLDQVSDVAPARVTFPAIRDSDRGRFWLRVFVREADVPVRIFEWRKYTAFGLGTMRKRAFCGFLFQASPQ